MICLLGIGLASAGTLTVSLSPSLDSKGDIIKAISITKAELVEANVFVTDPTAVPTYAGTVKSDSSVQFDLSGIAPGDYFIRLNNRSDNTFPTRIDDPTKNINQFVGRTLRISVIGNLSNPVYIFKTYLNGLGPVNCSDGYQVSQNSYIQIALKNNPQKLEVHEFNIVQHKDLYGIGARTLLDYTQTIPYHPSTPTSSSSPFSKWVFSHGSDYGGNDSKCSSCHGNLSTKPASFSEITVNNGFCYRCHSGPYMPMMVWLVQEDVCPYHPHATSTPVSIPTLTSTPLASITATYAPTTPAFEGLSAIAALVVVFRCRQRG